MQLKRDHEKIHQAAEEAKKARTEVEPFLEDYTKLMDALTTSTPEEQKSEIRTMYERVRPLVDRYGVLPPEMIETVLPEQPRR